MKRVQFGGRGGEERDPKGGVFGYFFFCTCEYLLQKAFTMAEVAGVLLMFHYPVLRGNTSRYGVCVCDIYVVSPEPGLDPQQPEPHPNMCEMK